MVSTAANFFAQHVPTTSLMITTRQCCYNYVGWYKLWHFHIHNFLVAQPCYVAMKLWRYEVGRHRVTYHGRDILTNLSMEK